MKSFVNPMQNVPTSQVKEAKSRRKDFDANRPMCRGFYRYQIEDGRIFSQLHAEESSIMEQAKAVGASSYFWFGGSLEEWLDGEAYQEFHF